VEFGISPDLGWPEHHDHKPIAPQFGDDRPFVTATRFDPDTLVSFPRVSSFFGSSDGVGVITDSES
jgi:hypothetical protein